MANGVEAEIFSPDGRNFGRFNATIDFPSHILISGNNVREGFWKIVFLKISHRSVIALDEKLHELVI